jgi:uncharacterized membrane protein YraQ (UPF0718 family)
MVSAIFQAILAMALTAAPWLLIGLIAAGLIKALAPEAVLRRWVGDRGWLAVARAAVIGAPLPLCSCGAIPTALTLYRGGVGRGPAVSFLISTPGIGVDSVAITYSLLGPFMVVVRVLGAVCTAFITGLLVAMTGQAPPSASKDAPKCTSGCGPGACQGDSSAKQVESLWSRLGKGIGYAFSDLLDDISRWLLLGLVLSGLLVTLAPPQVVADYGSGLGAMLLMAAVGIPLYICAAAAAPVGAGMIMAGVSPGTVLVFLLAGPITSTATLGLLRREMGNAALALYFLGILATTIIWGLVVDGLVARAGIDIISQAGAAQELLPPWLEWTALVVLIPLAIPKIRRIIGRMVR